MKVVLFHRGIMVVGSVILSPGISLTDEHLRKLADKGIGILICRSPCITTDGVVNQAMDQMLEGAKIGVPESLYHRNDPAVKAASLLAAARRAAAPGEDDEEEE
jgi:hypothetical protein